MTQTEEYKQLIFRLIGKLQDKGFEITHVNGHPDFPQPAWVQQTDEWILPDVVAEDKSRGLIIFGNVKTADSWNTESADTTLKILQTCAHEVYVMVPDSVINHAKVKQRKERWKNVIYISPSSRE